MNIENVKAEVINQLPGLIGIKKMIELAGRTCYKSEDAITETSASHFVDRMIKNKHYAMLEHGTVYLVIPSAIDDGNDVLAYNFKTLITNKYTKYVVWCGNYYITTNYRVIIENNLEDLLTFIDNPSKRHIKRITVKLTTNIGVTREGNRHRVNSIAEESTRYCNYSKKNDGNLTIVPPTWVTTEDIEQISDMSIFDYADKFSAGRKDISKLVESLSAVDLYAMVVLASEFAYNVLTQEKRLTPQQARDILPLAIKSDIVYTAFADDWEHFIDLRLLGTTGAPHPNMKKAAACIYFAIMNDPRTEDITKDTKKSADYCNKVKEVLYEIVG